MSPRSVLAVVASIVVVTAAAVSAQHVELVKVAAQKLERTVQLPGEFTPYQRVSVYARVPSFVQEVHVDRGSVVKRGQLLVRLTAPELAAQVAETEARAQAVMLQLAEAEAKLVSAKTTAEMLKAASNTPGAVSMSEIILSEQAFQAAQSVRNAVENSARAARASRDSLPAPSPRRPRRASRRHGRSVRRSPGGRPGRPPRQRRDSRGNEVELGCRRQRSQPRDPCKPSLPMIERDEGAQAELQRRGHVQHIECPTPECPCVPTTDLARPFQRGTPENVRRLVTPFSEILVKRGQRVAHCDVVDGSPECRKTDAVDDLELTVRCEG